MRIRVCQIDNCTRHATKAISISINGRVIIDRAFCNPHADSVKVNAYELSEIDK